MMRTSTCWCLAAAVHDLRALPAPAQPLPPAFDVQPQHGAAARAAVLVAGDPEVAIREVCRLLVVR
jgi:hypothetical protein